MTKFVTNCTCNELLKRQLRNCSMSKKSKSKSGKSSSEVPLEANKSAISLDKSGNIIIQVLAKPGAQQNGITGITSEEVGIRIAAPPTEGEANKELVKYVSGILGLSKSNVVFDKGMKSRNKVLKITTGSISLEEVRQKIEEESKS